MNGWKRISWYPKFAKRAGLFFANPADFLGGLSGQKAFTAEDPKKIRRVR
jgi:hypothetical protein